MASLQQMLGNASKKVASVKSDLATVTNQSPGPVTQTPVTVVNLPVEAEEKPSTVKTTTFAAKNNAPVSFAPQRPVSPFGKPQIHMAKVSTPPALEPEEEEEEEPQHAPLERQKGKRYLRKPTHLRFSNLEEEGPVADPTVFGTTRRNRNVNTNATRALNASRQSINQRTITPLRGRNQPLYGEEAGIFAKITANADTAEEMLAALDTYTLNPNSKKRMTRKIYALYGNQ